jgi:hypothetical protein
MGPSATGWAFPAWSLHDLTIWPEDRFPDVEEGVWVIFEGPDKITWIATYGKQEYSVQNLEDDLGENGWPVIYKTGVEWDFRALPEAIPKKITGTLSSRAGVPNPPPQEITLQKTTNLPATPPDPDMPDPFSWADIETVPVDLKGRFEVTYTRPVGEREYWYRMYYGGSIPFWPCTSTEKQISDTAVDLSWVPPTPIWQVGVPITGKIVDYAGVGLEDKRIEIQVSRNGGTTWTLETSAVSTWDGTWSVFWTRSKPDIAEMLMRAAFLGDEDYDREETDPAVMAVVEVPVFLSWNLPAFTYGVQVTIDGRVWTDDYGVPQPSLLEYQSRTPISTGSWSVIRTVQPAADGTFSFAYVPNIPSADYRMVYPGTAPYLYRETTYQTRTISTPTTTTAPSLPATLTHGTAFIATGTVREESGAVVTAGAVQLWYRFTNGPDVLWKRATGAPQANVGANGSYTLSHSALTVVGPLEWRVEYLGDGGYYLASTSPAVARAIGMPGVVSLTKTAADVTHTSAKTSWTTVSGAEEYEVVFTGATTAYQTGLTVTKTGLSNTTDYTFTVRARKKDAGENWVYGASASAKCYTGRPQVKKVGSDAYQARPTGTATYRPSDAWAWNGDDVVQGYYSTSTNNAYGVMTYDGAAFRTWCNNKHGSDVTSHLTFTKTQVAMYRMTGSGSSAGLTMWWHVTGSTAGSGGTPSLAGGSSSETTLTPGASAWVTIPYAHWGGHVLLNENLGGNGGVYVVNSFCLYRANSSEYGKFEGVNSGGNVCDIYVEIKWDFETQSYIASKWY